MRVFLVVEEYESGLSVAGERYHVLSIHRSRESAEQRTDHLIATDPCAISIRIHAPGPCEFNLEGWCEHCGKGYRIVDVEVEK